jgi:hypothetical protein
MVQIPCEAGQRLLSIALMLMEERLYPLCFSRWDFLLTQFQCPSGRGQLLSLNYNKGPFLLQLAISFPSGA